MNFKQYKQLVDNVGLKDEFVIIRKLVWRSRALVTRKRSKFEGQRCLIVGGTMKGTASKIRLETETGQRFSTSYRNVELVETPEQMELI